MEEDEVRLRTDATSSEDSNGPSDPSRITSTLARTVRRPDPPVRHTANGSGNLNAALVYLIIDIIRNVITIVFNLWKMREQRKLTREMQERFRIELEERRLRLRAELEELETLHQEEVAMLHQEELEISHQDDLESLYQDNPESLYQDDLESLHEDELESLHQHGLQARPAQQVQTDDGEAALEDAYSMVGEVEARLDVARNNARQLRRAARQLARDAQQAARDAVQDARQSINHE